MGQIEKEAFDALGRKNLGVHGPLLGSMPKSIRQAGADAGYNAAGQTNLPRPTLWPGITGKSREKPPVAGGPTEGNAGSGSLSADERSQLSSLMARLLAQK